MDKPRVTIIMSVKDGLPFLSEAIDSVLNQTFRDYLLLIIDDGSTDGSVALIEAYVGQHGHVRLERNPRNLGLAASLARSVKLADTEFVARMDPDDIALPRRLEQQVAYLDDHKDVAILGTWATDIDEHGQPLRPRNAPANHDAILSAMVYVNPLVHPTVMFRRDAVVQVGSYDASLRVAEDYDLWFRCAAHGLRFANLEDRLLLYRVPKGTIFRKRARYGTQGVKTRWRGYKALHTPLSRRLMGLSVPIALGLVPSPLRESAYRIVKWLDPRQHTTSGS